jgi:hypothetical protein
MSIAQDDVRFFFADAPRFRKKPVAQDDVRLFFAMLRLSRRPDDIKFSFCFFVVGIVQPTGWQGTTSTRKMKREQPIRRRQSGTTAILFSFPFVGVVQPTGWQGTTSTTKEQKENDQAVTIDKSSDPVLSSFRRRRSTHWMAGHDVYYKRTKENDQAVTIDNNSDTRATINNNDSPLPRKSNNKLCVLAVKLE